MTKKEIDAFAKKKRVSILTMDGLDDAFMGILLRPGQTTVAVYDYDKIVHILSECMTVDQAIEYYDFNIGCAWVGPKTPIIVCQR